MGDFGIDDDKWTEEIEHENEQDEAEALAQHKDQDWYVQWLAWTCWSTDLSYGIDHSHKSPMFDSYREFLFTVWGFECWKKCIPSI